MASSMVYFPLVGAWLGVILWTLDYALKGVLPEPVVIVLLIAFLALVTGGLHLDGFADTLDGIFGGRGDKARALEIMKDSRVGAMGVIGLVLLLLLKFEALNNLRGPARWQALILMPMLARWSQVQLSFGSEYARKEGSLAQPFVEFLQSKHFIVATLGAMVIALWMGGRKSLVPFAVVAVFTLAAKHYFKRKLGGVTGDTIGAVSELNEVIILLVFLI